MKNSTLTATNFVNKTAAEILNFLTEDFCEKNGIDIDQKWQDEQTIFIFSDNSKITIENTEVTIMQNN